MSLEIKEMFIGLNRLQRQATKPAGEVASKQMPQGPWLCTWHQTLILPRPPRPLSWNPPPPLSHPVCSGRVNPERGPRTHPNSHAGLGLQASCTASERVHTCEPERGYNFRTQLHSQVASNYTLTFTCRRCTSSQGRKAGIVGHWF